MKRDELIIETYRRLTLRGWQWRWRARHANGKILAHGGESYFNIIDMLAAIGALRRWLPVADVKQVAK